jgi:hypothetical protein
MTCSTKSYIHREGFRVRRGEPMAFLLLAEQFQVPGIPATMALAAVALIGYLAGRRSRPTAPVDIPALDIDEALADARQLEQITDEVLSATREALEQIRMLRMHRPLAETRVPATSSAERMSA